MKKFIKWFLHRVICCYCSVLIVVNHIVNGSFKGDLWYERKYTKTKSQYLLDHTYEMCKKTMFY